MSDPLVLAALAVAVVVLGGAYVVCSVTWPHAVMALGVGLVFSNFLVNVSYTVGVSVLAVAPYGMMMLPAVVIMLTQRPRVVHLPVTLLWLAALITWGVVSTLFSARPATSADVISGWVLEGLFFIFLLINSIRRVSDLILYVTVVVGTAGFIGLLVTFEGVSGQFWRDFMGFAQNSDPYDLTAGASSGGLAAAEETHRSSGMIGEPNFFAMYMACMLPWAIYLAVCQPGIKKLIGITSAGAITGAILYSYSRGALLALGLTVVVMVVVGLIPRVSLMWAGLAGIGALLAMPTMMQRMMTLLGMTSGVSVSTEDASSRGRASELVAASRVTLDHFLLGVGPGQFPDYYQQFGNDVAGGVHTGAGGRQAHNLVLGMSAEVGFVGVLFFLAVGLTLFLRLYRLRNSVLAAPASAAAGTLVVYFCASLFLHLSYARYLWLYVALGLSVVVIDTVNRRPRERTKAAIVPARGLRQEAVLM